MLTRTPDHPTAEIVGWGSFQSFYGYSAYDPTAKISWCLAEAFRGQGRGKSPVAHGLARAPGLGIRTLPGYLSARNEPRLRLFRACGVAGLAQFAQHRPARRHRPQLRGCGKARARPNRNGSFWPNCPPTARLIVTEKAAGSAMHHYTVPLRHRVAASATSGPTCNPLVTH